MLSQSEHMRLETYHIYPRIISPSQSWRNLLQVENMMRCHLEAEIMWQTRCPFLHRLFQLALSAPFLEPTSPLPFSPQEPLSSLS